MADFNGNEPFDIDKQDMIGIIRELRKKTGTIESAKSLNELTESINSIREQNTKLKSQADEKCNTIKKLEVELNALQESESKVTSVINGIENANLVINQEVMLKQNNEIKQLVIAIQAKLGIKVKLTQHEDAKHMWTSRFIFDKNENDSQKYVTIVCDSSNDSFKLIDMYPKPSTFVQMSELLEKTNDISGFLYNCSFYFQNIA